MPSEMTDAEWRDMMRVTASDGCEPKLEDVCPRCKGAKVICKNWNPKEDYPCPDCHGIGRASKQRADAEGQK
jgi:DnaJ-class molecular chaperone